MALHNGTGESYSPFPQNKYKRYTMGLDNVHKASSIPRANSNATGQLDLQLDHLGGSQAPLRNETNPNSRLETQQSQGSPGGQLANIGKATRSGYARLRSQNPAQSMTAIGPSMLRQGDQMRSVKLSQNEFANQIEITHDAEGYQQSNFLPASHQGGSNIHI